MKPECRGRAESSCTVVLGCGHACGGVRAECADDAPECAACLPCLAPDCAARSGLQQTADDYCNICWTECLAAAPALQLACGHVFHEACVRTKVASRWQGHRIMFSFIECPLCKADMDHWTLRALLQPILELKTKVRGMAHARLAFEGLLKDPAVTMAGGPYFGKPIEFAMDRFCYYTCAKCKQPYFGGMRQCGPAGGDGAGPAGAGDGAGAGAQAPGLEAPAGAGNGDELICPGCQVLPPGAKSCDKHGKESLEWKCKYCCGVAVWFCFGTTHFCEPCHQAQCKHAGWWAKKGGKPPICPGPAACPLRCSHPPNGVEFAFGCEKCRIDATAGAT